MRTYGIQSTFIRARHGSSSYRNLSYLTLQLDLEKAASKSIKVCQESTLTENCLLFYSMNGSIGTRRSSHSPLPANDLSTGKNIRSQRPLFGDARKWSCISISRLVIVGLAAMIYRCTKAAVTSFNSIRAMFFPKHARGPFENGMNNSFIWLDGVAGVSHL